MPLLTIMMSLAATAMRTAATPNRSVDEGASTGAIRMKFAVPVQFYKTMPTSAIRQGNN